MHVGIDAYLAHLTVIEILTVLVAQRLGDPAVQRLRERPAQRCRRTASTCAPSRCRAGTAGAPTARPRTADVTRAMLLEGGLVVDGTRRAGVAGRRAAASAIASSRVGAGLRDRLPDGLALADVDVVDCRGLAIAPGFIDAHTHDDAIVLRDPACLPKLSQGITTVVTGNCGISLAPYVRRRAAGRR